MPGFKRTRYLACFYCGRKTSTPYDGRVRQFECPSCDATNYLDENGDITDPPVSVTKATTPQAVNYAVPRPTSPSSSPSGAVFCETCLKNQHLVTSSLAQYLPDDPDSPDYAELEKKYYKFRNGLEQRYPQICADCEPRVRQRIERSAYTAKTDALRRMIDRTEKRRATNQRSPLYLFDILGRWLRAAGLILQMLWHASMLYPILVTYATAREDISWVQSALHLGASVFGLLPTPEALINWGLTATVCGSWWNPRFVQSVRGFTKHLTGFSNWYMYQVMIVVVRWACLKLSSSPSFEASEISSQVGCHLLTMVFSVLVYKLSGTSIRTDTAPLFGSNVSSPAPLRSATKLERRGDDSNSLSDALDEIMQTPSVPSRPSNTGGRAIGGNPFFVSNAHDVSDSDDFGEDFGAPPRALANSNNFRGASATTPPAQDGDEMDWSPGQPQSTHRAFSVYRTDHQQPQGFGQAPTEPKKGHFWYRVPPPPTTPAQRLFNPPNQPRLRKSPVTKSEISFRGAGGGGGGGTVNGDPSLGSADESRPPVAFAQPSFFPPPAQNDPRNSLSDLFTDAFSLTPSQEEQANQQRSWVGNLMGFMNPTKTDHERS